MIRFPSLFSSLSFLALAVSAPVTLAAPKSAPVQKATPPVQINGQIFVVTEGHESVKLALVMVGQISESDIVKVNGAWKTEVEKRRLLLSQQLADVSQQLRDSKRTLDTLKEERQRAGEKSIECAMTISTTSPRYHEEFAQCSARPDIKEAQEKAVSLQARLFDGQLDKQIVALRGQLNSLMGEFDKMSLPIVPLDAYQDHITAVVKSDADGKFSFSYKPDQKVVLFAQSSRRVGTSSENYRWLVRLPARRSSDSLQLMLANDNMDVSGCSTCVTHVVSLDPYPDVETLRGQLRDKLL